MLMLIIFDWDDVITIGSKDGYFNCYEATLRDLGVEIDPEEMKKRILSKWGRTLQESISELLKDRPELIEKASQIYESYLLGETFVNSLRLLPGTIELLQRLHEKYILAVTTGVSKKIFHEKIIPKFKIPSVFSQVIFAEDIEPGKQKPSTYTIDEILDEQSTKSEEAIMVGDSQNDVMMAMSAKVEPVVVLTGHLDERQAQELGVKKIITSILDLEKVL